MRLGQGLRRDGEVPEYDSLNIRPHLPFDCKTAAQYARSELMCGIMSMSADTQEPLTQVVCMHNVTMVAIRDTLAERSKALA